MDTKDRKADKRQFEEHRHRLSDGHTAITTGNIPDALDIEPKGEKGELLVRIYQLQVELITDARSFGTENVTNLKEELTSKELCVHLDAKRLEAYETGLRRLRDELRAAYLKRADKTSPVTGLLSFRYLSQFLAEHSRGTIQESVNMLLDKYNVSIEPGYDVKRLFIDCNNIKRKRASSSSDSETSLAGPSSKRRKQRTPDEAEGESDEEFEETTENKDSSKAKVKQAVKAAALSKKSAALSKKSAALSKKSAALSKESAVMSKQSAVLSKKAAAMSKKAAVSPKAPITKQQSTPFVVDIDQSTRSALGSAAVASTERPTVWKQAAAAIKKPEATSVPSQNDGTTAMASKKSPVDKQGPEGDAVTDPKSPDHATKAQVPTASTSSNEPPASDFDSNSNFESDDSDEELIVL